MRGRREIDYEIGEKEDDFRPRVLCIADRQQPI